MRLIKYFILVLLFSYCSNNRSYNISWTSYKSQSFSDTPKEIQLVFDELYKYDEFTDSGINIGVKSLICLDTMREFEFKSIPTRFGPWTSRIELTDLNNDIIYKLKYNTPTPVIIFNNKLYVSESYNFTNSSNRTKIVFRVYRLK